MAVKDGLAEYIVNDLFSWMSDERKSILEDQWMRNYDAFRSKYNSEYLKKWRALEGSNWRSQVFCRLTKQKVVTGFNHVAALMVQNRKLPLVINPSPIPQNIYGFAINPDEASARAKGMETRIHDDWSDCRAENAYLTSLLEGAIYGVNWMLGPVLRPHESMAVKFGLPDVGVHMPGHIVQRFGSYSMDRVTTMRPEMEAPSVWNMFWDMEVDQYQTGQGIIKLELMSPGRFHELIRRKGYDRGEGLRVINGVKGDDGGVESDSLGPLRQIYGTKRRVIPVYSFWGRVPVKYLRQYGLGDGRRDSEEVEVYAVCAKSGSAHVIRKPVENPLSYRPAYLSKWQDIPNEPGGVGIPEDIEDTQMIINGLTRAMLDNKNLSSNLLMMWNPRFMAPGQNKTIYPGKSFELDQSAENIRQVLDFFAPPDVTGNTPQLIELFKQSADDETGINRTMEGSMGGVRKTAFEVAQAGESGNKLMGGVCRNQDSGIIEPIGTGFYHYHMLLGKDEAIKGDFKPKATGFQSWQAKAVRGAKLMELAGFTLANAFTARYAKVGNFLSELAKMSDFDPVSLYYTDDEVNQNADALSNFVPGMSEAQDAA